MNPVVYFITSESVGPCLKLSKSSLVELAADRLLVVYQLTKDVLGQEGVPKVLGKYSSFPPRDVWPQN